MHRAGTTRGRVESWSIWLGGALVSAPDQDRGRGAGRVMPVVVAGMMVRKGFIDVMTCAESAS
jgi:hypothetical protein